MRFVAFLVCLCVASVSLGQQYAPGSTAVVNQQAIVPVGPPPAPGLPFGQWTDGMRETWTNTHEIRPVRPWEGGEGYPAYQQPGVYQQPTYYQQPAYPAYCQQQSCQQPCQYYQQPCCQQYYQQYYQQPRQSSWYWYPGCNLGF